VSLGSKERVFFVAEWCSSFLGFFFSFLFVFFQMTVLEVLGIVVGVAAVGLAGFLWRVFRKRPKVHSLEVFRVEPEDIDNVLLKELWYFFFFLFFEDWRSCTLSFLLCRILRQA
jgi:hypothetical protein